MRAWIIGKSSAARGWVAFPPFSRDPDVIAQPRRYHAHSISRPRSGSTADRARLGWRPDLATLGRTQARALFLRRCRTDCKPDGRRFDRRAFRDCLFASAAFPVPPPERPTRSGEGLVVRIPFPPPPSPNDRFG